VKFEVVNIAKQNLAMHEYNARVSKFKINFDKEESTQKEPE